MFNIINIINLDIANKWQCTFQDESTTNMIGIRDLHDNILFYLIIILLIVSYLLFISTIQYSKLIIKSKDLNHNSLLEFIWTIIPCIILIIIAIPSFKLLYNMEQQFLPLITLKIIGAQWFWNYEVSNTLSNSKCLELSSYLNDDYKYLKFLETDKIIYLPVLTNIKLIILSNDVMHSWTIPSFGIKLDAIPGRLNSTNLYVLRQGLYYGQCSELCGIGHSLMPIEIKVVDIKLYLNWLYNLIT